MKSLDKMNNVEKAKLLHELFPQEIPGYLENMKQLIELIQINPDTLRAHWEGQLLSIAQWEKLAQRAKEILEKYGNKLHQKSRLFSDQLFDGYLALFSIHCLLAVFPTHTNQRFLKVIHAFFN